MKKKRYGIDSPLSYKQWFLNTHTFVYSNATKSQVNGSTLTFVGKYKDIRFRMDDKELVKCLIPHWKWETISFFLIMVVNGLICIGADIGLNIGLLYFIHFNYGD